MYMDSELKTGFEYFFVLILDSNDYIAIQDVVR